MSGLRKVGCFADLPDADLALLDRLMVTQTHGDGHVYVREGDRPSAVTGSMYVILEGEVAVSAAKPEGGFAVHKTMKPGEMFGAVALLADIRRTATVKARGEVTTARLDRLTFEELFHHDVGVHARFQMLVARQVASDVRMMRKLLTEAIATGDVTPVHVHFGSSSS
jgi:CRP-like cAMP-binding protein